jgi:signal transduction histidine kinase
MIDGVSTAAEPAGRSRLALIRRDRRRGIAAGVCAGIARSVGIDPLIVRLAFVAAAFAGGLGIAVYGLAWLFVPDSRGTVVAGRISGGPGSLEIAAGAGFLVVSVLLLFRALGWFVSDAIAWPALLAAVGGALIWRHSLGAAAGEATTTGRREVARTAPPLIGRRALSAIGLGAALVLGSALVFLWANGAFDAAGDVVLAAVVVALAVALILAPLWWRLARGLATERAERIRSQERAAVAAHLHDSVLQTLALVQRRADHPREVAALARRQERELRAWLLNRPTATSEASLAAALDAAAAEIEDAHGATVEVVTVGDAELDERGEAVVAAAREAILNCAKFAGAADVFAEVTDGRIEVFVRDRGPGFDLDAVPEERRGVRESIVGRMERAGGSAVIRSGWGAGTEVKLSISRSGG